MLNVNQLIGFGAGESAPAGLYRYIRYRAWENTVAAYLRIGEVTFLVGATAYPTVAMTANNAPSPLVATGISTIAAGAAYNAFDKNDANYITFGGLPCGCILDLGAGNAITPTGMTITPNNAGGDPFPSHVSCEASTTGAFAGEQVTLYPQTATPSGWTNGVPRAFTF